MLRFVGVESPEILFDIHTEGSLLFYRNIDKRYPKISWVFPVNFYVVTRPNIELRCNID